MSPAAQCLGGVGERDEVAARPDGAVAGDGGREGRGEHRGEPLDDLGGDPGDALGEGPGAQEEGGAADLVRQVRLLAGPEVGQGVVALVGLVGAPGVADEGAESRGGSVDRGALALAVPQSVQEAAAAVEARPGLLVHEDGERGGRAAQVGGVRGPVRESVSVVVST